MTRLLPERSYGYVVISHENEGIIHLVRRSGSRVSIHMSEFDQRITRIGALPDETRWIHDGHRIDWGVIDRYMDALTRFGNRP